MKDDLHMQNFRFCACFVGFSSSTRSSVKLGTGVLVKANDFETCKMKGELQKLFKYYAIRNQIASGNIAVQLLTRFYVRF